RQINSSESDAQHAGSDETGDAYERPQAMLDDSWNKSHMGGGLAELQKKLDWSKKKVTSETTRSAARVYKNFINQLFGSIERESGDRHQIPQDRFDDYSSQIEEKLKSDEGKKLLTPEEIAEFKKRLEKDRADQATANADSAIAEADKRVKDIQET